MLPGALQKRKKQKTENCMGMERKMWENVRQHRAKEHNRSEWAWSPPVPK